MADNEKEIKKTSGKSTNKASQVKVEANRSASKKNAPKKTNSKSGAKKPVKKTTSKDNLKKEDKKEIKETVAKKVVTESKQEEVKEERVLDKKVNKEKSANVKQARKQLYYTNNSSSDELSKLIKIVLIVTAIIIVFYGVTVVVTNKAKEATADNEPVEIQYDSIMIGSMLNIDGSYYVLIEDSDDVKLSEYTTFIQTIKASEDAPSIYTADLSSGFNKKYLSDESNYNSDMNKFKVKGTTLVRVSDHEIKDVYDNYDDIINKLDELD